MNRREILKLILCAPSLAVAERSEGAQAPHGRVFGADAGMILNTIKPEKAPDFEMVVDRVKQALQSSSDPVRKQQAAGWKVFKAREPGANNTVLYVFWLNPAVKGADYTISKILYEAFPNEVQDLYKKFSEAYGGGQTLVNLELLRKAVSLIRRSDGPPNFDGRARREHRHHVRTGWRCRAISR
jgi:hypothetical protein